MSINELTETAICACDNPYFLVSNYVNEFAIAHSDEAVALLPPGLQNVLLILDLDSEYMNGGLAQYFGNRTDDSGRVFSDVTTLPAALEATGASKLAELVRRATTVWQRLVDDDPRPDGQHCVINREARAVWFKAMDAEMDRFDHELETLYHESLAAISDYIRNHPRDFCHTQVKEGTGG
jgi:hypothetical protein